MRKLNEKNAPTLRAILAGERYSRRVEGGNMRAATPCDGLLVVLPDEDLFFALADVELALAMLGERRRAVDSLAAVPKVPGDKGSL